jgi:hypothetical protein
MSVNDESAASRQFVASSAAYSSKSEKFTGQRAQIYAIVIFVVIVALGLLMIAGPTFGIHLRFPHIGPVVGYGALAGIVVVVVGMVAYLFWRSRRKYLITVASDGLTIDRRRDDVYSLDDAQLGPWVGMGVALHLHCGRHRFFLGGRDRRVGPATPLNAPPVWTVDAWLPESDFDELLSLGGHRSGSAARGPAPGEPTRCLLFPNPLLMERTGSLAFRKKRRLMRSLAKVQLFIDVDRDAIGVVEPSSNAVNASAPLSQVTATPATYQPPSRGGYYGSLFESMEVNTATRAMSGYISTSPALAVCVPGMQPVTIGCRDFRGLTRRFSWPRNVPTTKDPPAYAVSAADWLTLAENFGLAPYLKDTASRATG